jgi:hypothetical protein
MPSWFGHASLYVQCALRCTRGTLGYREGKVPSNELLLHEPPHWIAGSSEAMELDRSCDARLESIHKSFTSGSACLDRRTVRGGPSSMHRPLQRRYHGTLYHIVTISLYIHSRRHLHACCREDCGRAQTKSAGRLCQHCTPIQVRFYREVTVPVTSFYARVS